MAVQQVEGIRCPHCGTWSNSAGPPQWWSPPAPAGIIAIMLVCPNPAWSAPLGTFGYPR